MARFLIVALALWLAIGGCAAPMLPCQLTAAQQHDCCPRKKPTDLVLKDCPYFVATKVIFVDAAPNHAEPVSAVIHPDSTVAPSRYDVSLIDQQGAYLSNRVLRI